MAAEDFLYNRDVLAGDFYFLRVDELDEGYGTVVTEVPCFFGVSAVMVSTI